MEDWFTLILIIWMVFMLADFVSLGWQQNRIEKKIDAAWYEICNLSEALAKVIARKS